LLGRDRRHGTSQGNAIRFLAPADRLIRPTTVQSEDSSAAWADPTSPGRRERFRSEYGW
jgi:hypothetical protein